MLFKKVDHIDPVCHLKFKHHCPQSLQFSYLLLQLSVFIAAVEVVIIIFKINISYIITDIA